MVAEIIKQERRQFELGGEVEELLQPRGARRLAGQPGHALAPRSSHEGKGGGGGGRWFGKPSLTSQGGWQGACMIR
jgi:hypothetical protein